MVFVSYYIQFPYREVAPFQSGLEPRFDRAELVILHNKNQDSVFFDVLEIDSLSTYKKGSSTFSVVLAQYPLLRRRNLSTYFERYYRNV